MPVRPGVINGEDYRVQPGIQELSRFLFVNIAAVRDEQGGDAVSLALFYQIHQGKVEGSPCSDNSGNTLYPNQLNLPIVIDTISTGTCV